VDVARQVAAHGNFSAFHPVYTGIATRTATRNRDFQARHEAQVHQVLGNGKGEFYITQDGAFSHAQIGQSAGLAPGLFLVAAEYEVENHFQFQVYSNSFPEIGNDQSHSRL
jgi:hypothetical protein